MTISEVILVMPDAGLDNFWNFGKQFARAKLKHEIAESTRLKTSLRKWGWILREGIICIVLVEKSETIF